MPTAYLQPTFAKMFVDTTTAANLQWLSQQSRYAVAAFVGVVETISYCSLAALFSLADFPLTMGYTQFFPHKAAHFQARSWGAAYATIVAAGTILGSVDPDTVANAATQACNEAREQLLRRFQDSLAAEADAILKHKQLRRKNKINLQQVFKNKLDKMIKQRQSYAQDASSRTPLIEEDWYDALRTIKYEIHCQALAQPKILWAISLDPYQLACQKAERCKNKIFEYVEKVPKSSEERVSLCLQGLAKATLNFDSRKPAPCLIDVAIGQVQQDPAKATALISHLKFYKREFLADLACKLNGEELKKEDLTGYESDFYYLRSPWRWASER